MTPQAQIVLLLWLPLVLFLCSCYKPRTAIIISYIAGELFLPKTQGFKVPTLATYGEDQATSYALVLGIILFSSRSLSNFKLNWLDLPIIIRCICPVFSSLSNDLDLKDAFKESMGLTFVWAIPYFLGRIYINNWAGLRELSINLIKGGLLYVPFCLYEARMSPMFHSAIYGYFSHESGLAQAQRLGGWRPSVFMRHGLVLALWMAAVTIIAIWLSQTKTFNKIWHIPKVWIAAILVINFILLKSTGAYFYLLYTVFIILIARYFKSNLPVWLLIIGIIFYLTGRITGFLSADFIGNYVYRFFASDRSESFIFRVINEEKLSIKALQKPLFGWGGWGRSRVYEENWQGELFDATVTDSLWIIDLGTNGLVGLLSEYIALILPTILFMLRYQAKTWFDARIALGACFCVVLLVYTWDTIYNNAALALFPLICGSLSSIVLLKKASKLSRPASIPVKKTLTEY